MSEETFLINVLKKIKITTEKVNEINTLNYFDYIEINNSYIEITDKNILLFCENNPKLNFFNYITIKPKKLKPFLNKPNITHLDSCLLLSTNYPNVYYHWIYDILPQLQILKSHKNLSILSKPLLYNYQIDSLKCYAPFNNLFCAPGYYKVKKIFLPYPSTVSLMPKMFAFEFLRINVTVTNNENNKIYITRKHNFKRRMLNEDNLILYLKSIGFKIYSLENLAFRDQLIIFSNASFILSAHGSGLANIIYCNKNCKILEIYGPYCGEYCFARIANKLDMHYTAIRIDELSYQNLFFKIYFYFFPNKNPFNFEIDLKMLDNYLLNLLPNPSNV